MSSPERHYGHDIPPFKDVLVKLLRVGAEAMSMAEIQKLAETLGEEDRIALGSYLGADGTAQLLEGLSAEKRAYMAAQYAGGGAIEEEDLRQRYPHIMATLNSALPIERLEAVLGQLTDEDIASQSLFVGNEGRRACFAAMSPEVVRTILDRTADWVFLVTGKQACAALHQYTATLHKQERLGRKLQGVEIIALKARERPRAFYMKWLDGPFKKRELLYDEQRLGPNKIRVREGGLLGVAAVTIGLDSPIAKRGTNHRATELGFGYLVEMMETDYVKAAPRGDVQRISHGIVELDGRPTYKMESVLPRDRKLGYYCHRVVHYLDYVEGIEVRSDVYGFDDQLQESYHYRDVDLAPSLTDADFDPKNKSYRL